MMKDSKSRKSSADDTQSYLENVGTVTPITISSLPIFTSGTVTPESHEAKESAPEKQSSRKFYLCSLWQPAQVNPANGKSLTFPILRIWDPYSTAFWLATLGFFVAFFSWFAFSPLVPEAVKEDLKLTNDQVINSNLASLGGTALVRIASGPACDRFGPRKILVSLLILGAIPSGLAALVRDIRGLEAVRFFISILGGTFVPTQAYTTAFFDKSIVGTANAFSGGWGNLGGGVTVAAMIGIYERFTAAGYTPHLSWRLCFLVVPVPCLLLVAASILMLGKDHPAGKWSKRHCGVVSQRVSHHPSDTQSARETAPAENACAPTLASFAQVLLDLRVWMCAICYCLTFGLETALDAALPGLVHSLFASEAFSAVDAAYVASTYGLFNLFARPLGGIVADILYARFGIRAKVYWLLATALSQGVAMLGLGLYINYGQPSIGGVIGFIALIAVTGFAANGACYALYSHLRPSNNGVVAGIVGASGNVGGIFYTLIFKYQAGKRTMPSAAYPNGSSTLGTKFWISGVVNAAAVVPLFLVPLGDAV